MYLVVFGFVVFGRKSASSQSAVNLPATIKAHQMGHVCVYVSKITHDRGNGR